MLLLLSRYISAENDMEGIDLLEPYKIHHGPKHRKHRQTRECQHLRYGNVTHSKHPAHQNETLHLPLVDYHFLSTEVLHFSLLVIFNFLIFLVKIKCTNMYSCLS